MSISNSPAVNAITFMIVNTDTTVRVDAFQNFDFFLYNHDDEMFNDNRIYTDADCFRSE